MMKIERGKGMAKKVIPLIILLLLIAGGVMFVKKKKAELASVPLPEKAVTAVMVTDAPWGTFAAHENFLGTVMPKIAADLSPRLTAHIIEVRVREGARVRKGELLAFLDDREQRDAVAALEAQLASARSASATEEAIFRRDRKLFDAKAISRETLELSTSRRDAARAQVTTLRKQLDSARTTLSYTRLEAPFDGVITERIMEPGELALPGKAVVAMEASDAGYYIEVKVPQRQLSALRIGDELAYSRIPLAVLLTIFLKMPLPGPEVSALCMR
jgi:RND family efflux transporter MFP subunit